MSKSASLSDSCPVTGAAEDDAAGATEAEQGLQQGVTNVAKQISSAVKQFPIRDVKQFSTPGLVNALERSAVPSTRTLEELLDINRAAKVLGIRPKTLRHHILRRHIDYVKIGGRVLFRPDTLWEFIERNTIRARQERPPVK